MGNTTSFSPLPSLGPKTFEIISSGLPCYVDDESGRSVTQWPTLLCAISQDERDWLASGRARNSRIRRSKDTSWLAGSVSPQSLIQR